MQLELPDDLYEEFQKLVERRTFETTASEYTQSLIRRELGQYNLTNYAERDKLTQCHTRNQLDADLTHKLSLSIFYDSPAFRFVCFDISDFKKYNDSYGFASGDQLLMKVADAIRIAFSGEPVYRVGGDEFIVALSVNKIPVVQPPDGIALKYTVAEITLPEGRSWFYEDGGAVRLYLYRGLSEAKLEGNLIKYGGERLLLAQD